MKQAVIGLLAHVDAGKTTLAEAMMFESGAIRRAGRVDHGDSHLDVDDIERRRGITIFSTQAEIEYADAHLTLLDAPGHVDFSGEAERILPVLDYALLVIDAHGGIQGHTETLWRLLERYGIPTFVFFNKMDLAQASPADLMARTARRLGSGLADASTLDRSEEVALLDEDALEEFLETGALNWPTIQRMVAGRRLFPCFFGSALHAEGVANLLSGLASFVAERAYPASFGARVFKVSHDDRHDRLTWLKVTSGCISAKDAVFVAEDDQQKVEQIRIYTGNKFESVPQARAGQVCAVTGLRGVAPGEGLGADSASTNPVLVPALAYKVLTGDTDVHAAYTALQELADEDPLLSVSWDADLQEIRIQLMGQIQLEVVREAMGSRFGLDIDFGPGSVLYKETIANAVVGIGHFEPLRHYAEAHVLIEPLPRGTGVQFGTRCSTDDLDLNWQRLILTNAMERDHAGVLTGAPLTDVSITLVSGRAHLKHTVGGDFRQATYRAIRQGIMQAQSVLLEPWYAFSLTVPAESLGRALSDLQRMHATFDAPESSGDTSTVRGRIPVSEVGDYPLVLAGYTQGAGSFSCVFAGYDECHNAADVVMRAAYDPCADLPNTPDSVFCSHGAGFTVKWDEVPAHAHVVDDPDRWRPSIAADRSFFGK